MSTGRPDTWMPLYWGAYLKDTTDLTAKEHGVYLLLLGLYWTNGGPITDDQARLARTAKLNHENDETLSYILERFFILSKGKWKQKRAEFELERATRIMKERKKAGKAGGLASGKARSKTEANGQANDQANSEANAKQKATPSPTPTPIPIKDSSTPSKEGSARKEKFPPLDRLPATSVPIHKVDASKSGGRVYPPPFLEFWAAWKARPTDTKAGAYKAWRGPVNAGRVDCETLVKAAKVMAGTDPQFVPLVATWVNREGWTATGGGNGVDKLPGATRDAQGVWRDLAGGAMTEAEVERARELAERVPP